MNHKKTAGIMGILLGLVLGVCIFSHNYVPPLADTFAGTFFAGNGPYQTSLAIYERDGKFEYINQNRGWYIRGSFEALEDGGFRIKCSAPEDSQIISEQVVQYEDLTVAVQVGEDLVPFQKANDLPISIGNF